MGNDQVHILNEIFGYIDLTSLNIKDTEKKIIGFCEKINSFKDNYPDIPNIAAICVFPNFIKIIKENITSSEVNIVSVAAGFPHSQILKEVKLLECKMSIENGANEIDIVMPIGKFLDNQHNYILDEISCIKQVIGNAKLKIIIETGLLKTKQNIIDACELAIKCGADFIKTSTGTISPSATLETVEVICNVIKEHFNNTGIKIGIKPSGGISTTIVAIDYYKLIKNILGREWLNKNLFRIGSSQLANYLLSDIVTLEDDDIIPFKYF